MQHYLLENLILILADYLRYFHMNYDLVLRTCLKIFIIIFEMHSELMKKHSDPSSGDGHVKQSAIDQSLPNSSPSSKVCGKR